MDNNNNNTVRTFSEYTLGVCGEPIYNVLPCDPLYMCSPQILYGLVKSIRTYGQIKRPDKNGEIQLQDRVIVGQFHNNEFYKSQNDDELLFDDEEFNATTILEPQQNTIYIDAVSGRAYFFHDGQYVEIDSDGLKLLGSCEDQHLLQYDIISGRLKDSGKTLSEIFNTLSILQQQIEELQDSQQHEPEPQPITVLYFVTFDYNGGNIATTSMAVQENTTIILPEYPGTKKGYRADSWLINGVAYQFGASYTVTDNVDAIVNWVPDTFTVTINVTNGTPQTVTKYITYGTSGTVTITPNNGYKLPSSVYSGATLILTKLSDTVMSIGNISNNITLTVNCELIPTPPDPQTILNWYAGQITKTRSQFAELTTEQLLAASQAYNTQQKTANITINKSCWFCMIPNGEDIQSAQYTASGITSNFTEQEIKNGFASGVTHGDIEINNVTYKVYVNRNTALVDSNTSGSFTLK